MQSFIDKQVFSEITSYIKTGYYHDERVKLTDLIFPEKSNVSKKIWSTGNFKNGFFKNSGQASGRTMSASEVEATYNKSNVVFYFPYSDYFQGEVNDFTIVPDPGDNPNVATGLRFANGTSSEVKVDELYVQKNPTLIVTFHAKVNEQSDGIKTGKTSGYDNSFVQVSIGCARLTRQMDPLFGFNNSGGSEVIFGRGFGYLVNGSNGQVEGDWRFSGEVFFSRSDISNQRIKSINTIWDPNWSEDKDVQVLAIWENDNTGSVTISGKVSVKIAEGVTLEKNISITRQSEDRLIHNQDWSRYAYIRTVDTYVDVYNLGGCENWWFIKADDDLIFTWPFYPWIP